MDRAEQARGFLALHVPGDPLILFNIGDAGSARAVAEAGAAALATGTWGIAAAFGHRDGEDLPRALARANLQRIARAVDLPVTLDLEGGYGEEPEAVAETACLAIGAGTIGCNFEDRIVGGPGLYPLELQQERIAAMHAAAGDVPSFINARTDLFLLVDRAEHAARVEAHPSQRRPSAMTDLCTFPIARRWPAQHPHLIQLYPFPTPNGVKASIALEELGLPYEPHLT